MNYELSILILLLDKELYRKYLNVIDISYLQEHYKEIYYIYKTLKELHELTENNVTLSELTAFFYTKYPSAKDKVEYEALFTQAASMDVSAAMASTILAAVQKRKAALALSEASYNYTQGRCTDEQLNAAVEAIKGLPEDVVEEDTFVTDDLDVLLSSAVLQPGLRWRLNCLNKSLGSLRKGDFGFIFARPETGKTTFLASEISFMLTQTDKPIIWFNNEEQGSKVMLRVYQAYFGCTLQQLISNANRYKMEWAKTVGHCFKLVDSAGISKGDVEVILKKSNDVGLIVLDQIDKIKGFEADRKDLALGATYQWARELAKTYAPTIGVCQADGSAEGSKWLTMQNVADAKTSKQAEADWICGIGKTHDINEESIRFLNLSKNKLSGDEDSDPSLRHGRFECLIQPEIARYKDIINYD